jgi:hypothetical protein
MNNWEWLVPVIILLIWIVNHFLRGADEDRPVNRPRGGDRPGEGRPARRSSSEIDRFLDEVNRRRRQAAERKQSAPPRERPAPATARTTRPSSPPRPASSRSAPPPRVVRQPLDRRPERQPPGETVVVMESVPIAQVAAASPSEPPLPPPPVSPSSQPPSAAMVQLASLLGSADSLRTAVVLHEIFSAPLSHRRHR